MALLTFAIITALSFHPVFTANSDVGLSVPQMIENHGYESETHYVTTEDGYIITLYRIPHGIDDDGSSHKPPVLLMHGFGACSGQYVSLGPKYGLAYILADAGYDVWLGNARGTTPSRNHTTLNADTEPEKYFNFTWHEIGYYDVATYIDYILEKNGDESLYYVGHSQGTTVFLVLASTRPEYNDKIRLASLMAPAAIVKHYPNIFIQVICQYVDRIWALLQKYKIYEIPLVNTLREVVSTECADYPSNYSNIFCDFAYYEILSAIDQELVPAVVTNCPSNAGLRQYVHYGQLVRDGGFRQWDYGTEENLEIYGTETPPDYDLLQISAPVAFFYAQNDGLITVEDENTLVSMVPNVATNYLVPSDTFGHIDFSMNMDVVELVYNKMLTIMKEY